LQHGQDAGIGRLGDTTGQMGGIGFMGQLVHVVTGFIEQVNNPVFIGAGFRTGDNLGFVTQDAIAEKVRGLHTGRFNFFQVGGMIGGGQSEANGTG